MRQEIIIQSSKDEESIYFESIEEQLTEWKETTIQQIKEYILFENKYEEILRVTKINDSDFKYKINRLLRESFCQSLKDAYILRVQGCIKVPSIYKTKYLDKYPFFSFIEEMEREFMQQLDLIIMDYIRENESELLEPVNETTEIILKITNDKSTYIGILESCKIELSSIGVSLFFYVLQDHKLGRLLNFTSLGKLMIDFSLRRCQYYRNERIYKVLLDRFEYIKGNNNELSLPDNDYINFYYSIFPLFDIKDKKYVTSHLSCKKLFFHHVYLGCDKILYFVDPNIYASKEGEQNNVKCYLILRRNSIYLFSLDLSKSTYVFSVKAGMEEPAIFSIWAYFSSFMINKREGKVFSLISVFNKFGILDITSKAPIKKDARGLYLFEFD